ncbi:MAG: O-antigen ligase family protein [Candidatus Magasanikbacteria bacterium]
MSILLFFAILCFLFITLRNIHIGFFLFFLLLPTYLIRFSILYIPTTFLEMMFLILLVVTSIRFIQNKKERENKKEIFLSLFQKNKTFFYALLLFLSGATISAFISPHLISALGEWKAFYVEPILFGFLLVLNFSKEKKDNLQKYIFLPLIISGTLTAILGIYQHFTGWMVPWDFWENRNTFRVTGWYGFPNAVGIFLAQIFPLGIYMTITNWKEKNFSFILSSLYILLCPLALLFAKGSGPILALFSGITLFLLFSKKTRGVTLALGSLGIFFLFFLSSFDPLQNEITMQDRSGQLRVEMWAETVEYLQTHPIRGATLANYSDEIAPWRIQKDIEIFHHPHNIFLTMWVNIGIIGLIGFIWILVWFFRTAWKEKPNKNIYILFLFATLFSWLVMGLVDSPYIKNDWSILFWTYISLLFIHNLEKYDMEDTKS